MALPDTIDLGGYEEEYQKYIDDVRAFNAKVNRGRSVRGVDPNQPALSQQADDVRQANAIAKSNRLQNAQDLPQELDLGSPQGNALPEGVDLSEGNSGRSRGIFPKVLETYSKYRPDWSTVSPEPSVQGIRDLGNIAQEIAAPFATARDYIQGIATGKPGEAVGPREMGDIFGEPSTDWRKNVIPALVETLDEFALPLGLGRRLGPTRPITPIPKVLTPIDLDIQVAERSLTKSAIETQAFPDPDLVPQVRKGTGNTLVVPGLEPGVHTETAQSEAYVMRPGEPPIRRMRGGRLGLPDEATIDMYKPEYGTLKPGEYGTGEQMDLLGGYNVRGTEPHLTGKYALTPEEQASYGMVPLREQQLTIPERTSDYQAGWNDFLTKALKTRILTPEEERTLFTPLAEQGRYPVDLKTSPTGRAVSAGPKIDESYTLPKEFNQTNTVGGAVFTSKGTRAFSSVIDVMRRSGPIGEGMASLFDMAYTNRAIGTSKDMLAATEQLDNLLGVNSFASRKLSGMRQFLAGENPFIFGMSRYWNITPAEEESLFNYMYTQRRSQPLNDKVRQAGEILFENGLYPASSDPGVRQLHITNPFTGKPIPLGEPGMFMPQQPINPLTANAINDTQWGILYQRAGGEKLGVSQETFKKTIIAISSHDPEVTAFKMKGIENMRLLDLEALGGSPYQWAKKLGYETDPFRATFRFNSLARLRGQLEQVKEPINQLLQSIPPDAGDASKWLHLAADRAMLNPGKYDTLQTTTNTIKGLSHILDVSMLQLGGIANLAQMAYVGARGGVRASVKGVFQLLTSKDRALVEQSGAVFPAALNELTNPSGPMAAFSSGAFRVYGLSLVDRNTRYFAGHVGNAYIKQVEQSFLKNPTSKRQADLLAELGGDPKAILQQGSIPDDMRLAMIQKFANYTSGVTDVRGIPLWASSENPWARLVNKFRTFAVANSSEVRRLVTEAPTVYDGAERVAKLLAGAYIIGGGINEGRKQLRDTLMGASAKPTKNDIATHAERLVQGLGTIEGMFLINAANRPESAVLSLVGGPAAGVGASFLQDLVSTAKYGVGWRTIDTLSKRTPIAGPIVGPMVGKEVKRESALEAERQKELSGY